MVLWKKTSTTSNDIDDERPALFLDRDGVMIVDRNYLSEPSEVEIIPGAIESMLAAQKAGYLLIGVSNQSGLGRGMFTADELEAVMDRFYELLADSGVILDAFYYCPHAPDANCGCRKPRPGLLDEAVSDFRWNRSRSWVVGDKLSDVKLGIDSGMNGALVRTGHGLEQESKCVREYGQNDSVLVCNDISDAINQILRIQGEGAGS